MIDLKHDFSRFARLEQAASARPTPWQRRILAELRFVDVLSQAAGGRWEEALGRAEAILGQAVEETGAISNQAAQAAEQELLPCAEEAKSYTFLCVAHAHIDMNWMWGFHETVGTTIDTFRTMLQIMKEYPQFRFSQSQASVYRILERFAPEMLEEVRQRVREGRWEVTASTWVENDKNMPSGESLLRQYLLAKRYLCGLFDLRPEDLALDFEPDTFGHSAYVPEAAASAGVKYYYHCRGRETHELISRWRAPSGAELLLYTEPDWYNADIGTYVAEQAAELAARTGSRTLLKVYGVGDHGGGPTRRDLDRIIEMDSWPVYPNFRFSTLGAYFQLLEQRRETFPVYEGEINFVFDGCYTTQTRIKAGNRNTQRLLGAAELFSAEANVKAGAPYPAGILRDAWEKVLFNQFHDIIPGSGVTETREYGSALYQAATAAGETRQKQAFYELTERMDTASLLGEEDPFFSRGEGGGAGFDMVGRATGKTRLYHVFQTLPWARAQTVEFVVWDYEGDEDLLAVKTLDGTWLDSQLVDKGESWGHHFVRIIARVEVPPCGWASYLVEEKPVEHCWKIVNDLRVQYPDTFVLENEKLQAEFASLDGALVSLKEKGAGRELLPPGQRAGFSLAIEGVAKGPMNGGGGMSSWLTGRQREVQPLRDVELRMLPGGSVRSCLELRAAVGKASTLCAEIYLDQGSDAIQFRVQCDWREFGGDDVGVPCLQFTLPESCSGGTYIFDVPFGFVRRAGREMDLPASSFVMAGEQGADALLLSAKEKYGYRCGDGRMALTLIRSAYAPDPTPEIGHHAFSFAVLHQAGGKKLAEYARLVKAWEEPPLAVSGRAHSGDLPAASPFLELAGETVLLSAVKGGEDPEPGVLLVRLYETDGKACEAVLRCGFPVAEATLTDGLERPQAGEVRWEGSEVRVALRPHQAVTLRLRAGK